ncbi:DUF1804 family protein [Kingella potus]|nr:DUF1804 family protein [Kingella potus]UOP00544.1 DUF1804 family protein [Kingella potus]
MGLRTAERRKAEARDSGDNWDMARAAATLTGAETVAQSILRGMMRQYEQAAGDLEADTSLSAVERVDALATLADALVKTVAANKRLMPETSELATALKVLEMLYAFVREKHPAHLPAFAEIIEPFGAQLEREFK